MAYAYENYRYDVLHYWHFCCELEPTTWQEARSELHSGPGPAALWYESLPKREQNKVRKQLCSDMNAVARGVVFKAPPGHGRARSAVTKAAVAEAKLVNLKGWPSF